MLGLLSQNWVMFIVCFAACYLLGSVNMAIIITKIITKKDIRSMGSGNAGFTNVLRCVGKAPAIMTIAFDFLKGVIAAFIGGMIFSGFVPLDSPQITEVTSYGFYFGGIAAIFGHMFPAFFKFKGGKGVVTSAALMLVSDYRVFAMILITFGIGFIVTRIISVSSLLCALMYPVYTFLLLYFVNYQNPPAGVLPCSFEYVITLTVMTAIVGLAVIIKHRSNIVRIIHGEEKKIKPKRS